MRINQYAFICLLFAAACSNPAQSSEGKLTMLEIDHKWVLVDEQKKVQYEVFFYDNGPDYPSEGLYRVVKNGKIGYADAATNAIVIAPQYDCAYPFENGKAKVSTHCTTTQDGEYSSWESDAWEYIEKK